MSNISKSASETAYQERLVSELEKYKWTSPDYLNGNIQEVTVNDLINNWRNELNRINADQLEGVELTDNEFKQVLAKISHISNSYEASKLLSMENNVGKIDGIYRDKNSSVTNNQITLTIFKKAEVSGGDSSYKIAREISTPNGNRFDLVLLINGLPLINIELKRADKSLDEAFGQFKRYYSDGEYSNNFMAFSQMMVINSEIETRYFATPKSLDDFNPAFVFHWADQENTPVNDYLKVVEQFLMIPMAHQMVGDYLVIDEASDKENRKHMVMRPYQVYALQSIEKAAFGYDTTTKIPHGGFVWHTTGSGKTITSFKTALFLSTRANFDKVIFLVDRRELDANTSESFKAYSAYEPVSVDDTAHTYQLKKQLNTSKQGIVVTTTFKLNALIKELESNKDYSLSDKKYVFIIDEAHRTTMGQMMGTIKEYFKKNGLFYGFTGTPLFEENNIKGKVNNQSELINTTEKLFGPLLHQYTIEEAIGDGNVLGFHVDYINTGEFKNYDDLRDKLIEIKSNGKSEESTDGITDAIEGMTDLEVEKEASKNGLFKYQDETHIPRVVTRILKRWESQSQGREFNSILTVAYKDRVIDYYHEFKKQMNELDIHINIAMTFSFGNENYQYANDEKTDKIDKNVKTEMFKDYGSFTGLEFIDTDQNAERHYFEDLVERTKRGGSGRNKTNIDLVIVADQLLTGYDSKRLNTLYVDRSLELQGLIQAYSRTNRVFGSNKEFGTIINFKYPRITEETVDEALKLYGSGGNNSIVIVDTYETATKKLAVAFEEMKKVLPEPTEWKTLEKDSEKLKQFNESYKKAIKQFNKVQQYYEYEWDEDTFILDEHEWLEYQGAHKNLHSGTKEPNNIEIIPLVGKTKLVGTQIIDAAHIIELLGKKLVPKDGVQTIDNETLRIAYEKIQELSNMGDDIQAQILKQFVDEELLTGNVPSSENFDQVYENWKYSVVDSEVKKFAKDWGLDYSLLLKSVKQYSTNNPDVIPYISDLVETLDYKSAAKESPNRLLHNINMNKELPQWMWNIKNTYKI